MKMKKCDLFNYLGHSETVPLISNVNLLGQGEKTDSVALIILFLPGGRLKRGDKLLREKSTWWMLTHLAQETLEEQEEKVTYVREGAQVSGDCNSKPARSLNLKRGFA